MNPSAATRCPPANSDDTIAMATNLRSLTAPPDQSETFVSWRNRVSSIRQRSDSASVSVCVCVDSRQTPAGRPVPLNSVANYDLYAE